MNESIWTHLGIVGAVLIPIILSWYDAHRQRAKLREDFFQQFGEFQTKIDAMWQWWIANGNKGEQGERGPAGPTGPRGERGHDA